MRNITLKKLRYAILASALMATSAFAGDPGDLFPDVNYEKSVSSPVSRPDSSIVRQDTAVYVTPRAQVKPPAPATVVKTPGTVTSTKPATPTEVASTKPATPADPNAIAAADLFTDKNPIYKIWGPYRLFTMKKFLNQSEQAEFDKEFSPAIKKALAVSQKDRQIAIEALTESSAKAAPAVKRLVLLNVVGLAIKNQNTLADRADRAMNVLPSLTDETLEVQQNKADCIYNLAMSAPDQANDTLWAMLCETEATLSILQVQSGFPKEALASLQKARAAYGKMYDRNAVHSEIMVEAQDWVKYANGASDAKNALKSILTEKPKDPDANNRVAMAYAVLYADLDAAEEYALNSGKEAVKTLGTTLKEVEFPKSGNDNAKVVSHSLRVAESLLAVAKAAPEQIERYALATLVYDRLDDLKEAYPNNTDNNMSSLHDAAKELIAANEYKAIVAPKVAPRPEPVANNTPNQPNNPNQQQQNAIQNFNERMQRLLRGGGGGGGGGGGRGGGGGGRGGRG